MCDYLELNKLRYLNYLCNINSDLFTFCKKHEPTIKNAAREGCLDMVIYLTKQGEYHHRAMVNGIINNHMDIVRYLSIITVENYICTEFAAINNRLNIMRYLISLGTIHSYDDIDTAYLYGSLDVLKYLTKLHSYCDHPIWYPFLSGKSNVIRYMVQLGNMDMDMKYTIYDNLDLIKYLVKIGYFDSEEYYCNNFDIARYLTQLGIKFVRTTDCDDIKLTKYSIQIGHIFSSLDVINILDDGNTEIVKTLIDINKIDIRFICNYAINHHPEIVKYLEEMGKI